MPYSSCVPLTNKFDLYQVMPSKLYTAKFSSDDTATNLPLPYFNWLQLLAYESPESSTVDSAQVAPESVLYFTVLLDPDIATYV